MNIKKSISIIVSIVLLCTISGCGDKKADTAENVTKYEPLKLVYQSLHDEYTWLEHFPQEANGDGIFESVNICGIDYSKDMTLEEFIKEGWVVEEYTITTTYKNLTKSDVPHAMFDEDNSIEKSIKFIEALNDTISQDTCKFLMRNPVTDDIVYVIVCREPDGKWKDTKICGYEYYWKMTEEDSFSINEITQDMSRKQIDERLLASKGSFAKAEYSDNNKINNIYYTDESATAGIRIKYTYISKFDKNEPYEKTITVSIRN
ncbi:MAG: hypothetical protein HDT39_12560 [Lachnospiraceae bacterium]|nr:hypothetical protein [Lachnospiraceae bacterium]